MADYESPAVIELGSLADFTQGQGWQGNADSIHFTIWGRTFTINYGHS